MRNYEVIICWSEEDQAFVAEAPELPGCMADGSTHAQALDNIETVIDEWIETARELGRPIPDPKQHRVAGQCALDPSDPRTIRLTKRELEVLSLVIEGRSSKDIAQTLNVSKRTIDVHLAAIYDKMQVSNRVQAMRRVVRLGLTTLAWIIHDVPVLMAVRRHVILRFAPNEAPRFGISGLGPEVVRYSPIYSRNACFADAPRMSS